MNVDIVADHPGADVQDGAVRDTEDAAVAEAAAQLAKMGTGRGTRIAARVPGEGAARPAKPEASRLGP
jgi:hypothetical protein